MTPVKFTTPLTLLSHALLGGISLMVAFAFDFVRRQRYPQPCCCLRCNLTIQTTASAAAAAAAAAAARVAKTRTKTLRAPTTALLASTCSEGWNELWRPVDATLARFDFVHTQKMDERTHVTHA